LRNPEVVRSIEQSLIAGMFSCLRDRNVQKPSLVSCNHETIMQRFRKALETNPDRALYLPEICAAINVPERTLRTCCQEQLGMGPKRYLQLRRLHLAHRALRSATQEETTVTKVATEFGFWHFSRFAGNYRQLFGEAPSATLNRNAPRQFN
jgi:transcriptional regulator GlxA family with amidase domain